MKDLEKTAEECMAEQGCLRVSHEREHYCPLRIHTCKYYTGQRKVVTLKNGEEIIREIWYKCNYKEGKK